MCSILKWTDDTDRIAIVVDKALLSWLPLTMMPSAGFSYLFPTSPILKFIPDQFSIALAMTPLTNDSNYCAFQGLYQSLLATMERM